MDREYISVGRQTRLKNHLSALRRDNFRHDGVDTADTSAIVFKRILNISRQVPVSHCGDDPGIEFRRGPVIGHTWAKELFSRFASAGISFQQL